MQRHVGEDGNTGLSTRRLAFHVVLHLAPLAVLIVLGSFRRGAHGLLLLLVVITTVVIAGLRLWNLTLTAHPLGLGAAEFTFVDSAGIDGSKAVEDHLLAELLQADMAIWALRANRPARAPDVALLSRLRQACDQGLRRRPPVIVALTGVDLLLQGWPFAEHLLPADAMSRLAEVIDACAGDLAEPCVVPLCIAGPDWNLAALESVILSHAPEALMVQRNRRRLENRTTVRAEVAKGLAGFGQLTRLIAGRWKL